MKFYYIFIILFVVVGHLQELKTILNDIEHMQEQLKKIDDHIKDLKYQKHIKPYVEIANDID